MFRYFRQHKIFLYLFIVLSGLGSYSCVSFYQKMNKFQSYAEAGNFEEANHTLESAGKTNSGRNRLLYFFNKGWTMHMLGQSDSSNKYFNQADRYIEDFQKNYALDALSLLSNPSIKPYQPESIENIMVNYYKAMNYLQSNNMEGALVEARKIMQKLYEQNDQFKGKQNRYSDDAFAHILIGLIYDASGDYNNAFIAYRNAVNAYKEVVTPNYGVPIPLQLKKDLLRTARATGLASEVIRYEKEFGLMLNDYLTSETQLVFFWENGFGPIKDQWSINFTKISSDGGFVTFANEEFDLSFPIFIGDMSKSDKSAFAELEFFRIAFPKYVSRKRIFEEAQIEINGKRFPLMIAQDINAISFKVLQDRMLRELATSIARFAVKKATEAAVRSQNQDIGAAVGLLNAITETADTRNWQTLPFEISYTRIPLSEGENSIVFTATGNNQTEKQNLEFKAFKGQTIFFNYRSLSGFPPEFK